MVLRVGSRVGTEDWEAGSRSDKASANMATQPRVMTCGVAGLRRMTYVPNGPAFRVLGEKQKRTALLCSLAAPQNYCFLFDSVWLFDLT